MAARAPKLADLDARDVVRAYRRWAPVYDAVFGRIVEAGVGQATGLVNGYRGRLLEVGVGTGLSLPHYRAHLAVTGIDLSPDMLARARERVARHDLKNVEALIEMDAAHLAFADGTFDVVVAMYVLTVVPAPREVMHEIARVVRPGGTVVIVNHFSIDKGLRGAIEKRLAGLSEFLGWRPEFPLAAVMVSDRLRLDDTQALKPFGLFTLLRFTRLP